jgi:hypothetical protein
MAFRKAQSINELPDMALIEKLWSALEQKRLLLDGAVEANQRLNLLLNRELANLPEEEIDSIAKDVSALSPLLSEKRVQFNGTATDKIRAMTEYRGRASKNVSAMTQQARDLAKRLAEEGATGEQLGWMQEKWRSFVEGQKRDFLGGLGDRELVEEVRRRDPRGFGETQDAASGGRTGSLYSAEEGTMLPEARATFEARLSEMLDAELGQQRIAAGRRNAARIEAQARMFSSETPTFVEDARRLREAGLLSDEQLAEINSMPREEVMEKHGTVLASGVAALEEAGRGGIAARAAGFRGAGRETPIGPDVGLLSDPSLYPVEGEGAGSGGGSGGSGGGRGPLSGDEQARVFRSNTFVDNQFLGGASAGAGASYAGGGYGGGTGGGGVPSQAGGSEGGGGFSEFAAGAAIAGGIGDNKGAGATGDGRKKGGFFDSRWGRIGTGVFSLGTLGLDLLTPGGRSAAESTLSAVGAGAGPALFALGTAMGSPALGAALAYAGPQAIGAMGQPYFDFRQRNLSLEQVTGENFVGLGGQSGFGNFLASLLPGGHSLQGAQTSARLANPFLATSEIDRLAETILKLGASSEEATSLIGDTASAVAELGLSAEFAATQNYYATASNDPLGSRKAFYVGSRIQDIARSSAFTQEGLEQSITQAEQTLGPTLGYGNAADPTLAYSSLLSRSGDETVSFFQQQGTAGKLSSTIETAANDPMTRAFLGVSQTLQPSDPRFQAQVARGQIQRLQQFTQGIDRDARGKLAPTGSQRAYLKSLLETRSDIFGGITVDEAIRMLNDPRNITPERAYQSRLDQERKKQQEKRDLDKRASGQLRGVIGPDGKLQPDKLGGRGIEQPRETSGFGGFMNRLSGLVGLPGNVVSTESTVLLHQSAEEREQRGIGGSVGSVGVLAQQGDIDPTRIRLENGRTLADAARDQDLMRQVNEGEVKIATSGRTLTAKELSKNFLQGGGATVTEKGGVRLQGEDQGRGTTKHEIGLAPDARQFFEIRDVRNPRSNAGRNAEAQRTNEQNRGRRALNDLPIYGG